MCHSFERLRVIREYRSPRTIRSFTKVFIFIMPIVLSPYYVHMGYRSQNTWSPYFIAVLSTFIFGTLQGVQDVLDDPFDGISEDDINLGQVTGFPSHSRFCLLLPSYPMSFFFSPWHSFLIRGYDMARAEIRNFSSSIEVYFTQHVFIIETPMKSQAISFNIFFEDFLEATRFKARFIM